jgi:hypothetical protein
MFARNAHLHDKSKNYSVASKATQAQRFADFYLRSSYRLNGLFFESPQVGHAADSANRELALLGGAASQ